ncbi:MFS general substrate transporter [Auricularia subglabra TFB-10046 SS5]|nr:MFS general substrate transporter [Auricularia subglabra TFB-10046 SS5]
MSDATLTVPSARIHPRPSSQSVAITVASTAVGPGTSTQSLRASVRGRGSRFWLVFVAITVSTFLSAIDTTSVSTALPTITHSLGQTRPIRTHDTEIADPLLSWVGSSFALGSTAVMPLSGRLAEIFGRRPVLLGALIVFAAGSALCGAAQNAVMLIVGRVIQGAGSATIQVLSSIVVSDLVSLRERGFFQGILGATWSLAAAVGPLLGGAFSQEVSWRWIFYINLPLTGVALVLVFFFLDLRQPTGSLRSKLLRLDWTGNFIIIASSTSCMIALSWAGSLYPWQSYRVLVPLCVGVAGLVAAILYEKYYAEEPTIPFDILSNRTSAAAYFSAFIHYVILINAAYFIPVYLQAVKLRTPLIAGLEILPLAVCISPAGILTGIHISKMGKYVLYNVLGFALIVAGTGSFSCMDLGTSRGLLYLFEILSALGYGVVESAGMFAVLAPLRIERHPPAQALLLFLRTLAQTWGLTIGSAILQNQLHRFARPGLPHFGPSTIPDMTSFPIEDQREMQYAYARSLETLWRVLVGVSGLGLLSLALMRDIPLLAVVNEDWGLVDRPPSGVGRRPGTAYSSVMNTPDLPRIALPEVSEDHLKVPSPSATPNKRTIVLPPDRVEMVQIDRTQGTLMMY